MSWGTIGAQFYSFNGTSKGTINAVFSASGSQQRSRVGRCSVLLPRILTSTEAGYIVDGGICRVYATYNGTQKDICTFVISSRNTVYRSPNHYLEIGGYGQLYELSFRNADGILSAYFTGTVAAATDTTITFDSAVGSTDLTGWIANVTVGATAPQGVIIESYDIATKTATIKYAWPNGTPDASDTYIVNGGAAATDDLDQFASTWLASTGWTLEAEGGATGTADGTLLYFVGETVLGALVDISDASGEWFRVKSFTPNDRTIEWRTTADSSGVTLSTTANTHGVILSLSEDYDYNIVTRVYPGGAGLSSNQLNLSGATYTLPAGFAYVTDPTYGIANTALEGGGGDGVAYVSEYPNWAHIQAASDATGAILEAKNQLAKQSVQYLQARSGARKFYRVRAEMITDVKPGQTIGISYTAPGSNPYTISESTLYIQEVNYSIGGAPGENRRIADLVLTETLLPRPDSADDVANSFKIQKNIIKRGGATGTTGFPGGGTLSGGFVILDEFADSVLSLTNTTFTQQTFGLDSQTANRVWAAPNGSDGTPAFRSLVEADLPVLTSHYLTLANSTKLGNERVLTAGTNISFVDTGANGTLTINATGGGVPPTTLTVSTTNAEGATHTHAITSSSNTSGGGSSLLKSDSNGDLKVRRMDVGDYYMIDGNRILSNELTNNLFIGTNSGNASATSPGATTERTMSLGASALRDATAAIGVVAIGTSAMQNSLTPSATVAIGEGSLINFNGFNMTAVGLQAGRSATNSQNNAFFGSYSSYNNTTGIGITTIGHNAGYSNVTGNFNTFLGQAAGYSNTASSNTFLGNQAGYFNTGNRNIFIGNNSGYYEVATSDKFQISSTNTTNPFMYGDMPNTMVGFAVATVEIGDNSTNTTLKNRTTDLTIDVEGGDLYLQETRLTTKTGSGDGGQLRVCAVELVGNFATSSGTGTDTGVRPNADHSSSGVTGSYTTIDDDPDSPNTGDYVRNSGSAAGYKFFGLDNMDASFVAWSYLTIKAYITNSGFLTDSARVYAQVFESDESTALTKEVLLGNQDSNGLSTVVMGWTAGDKTAWDGARLRLRWTYNGTSSNPGIWKPDSTLLLNNSSKDAYLNIKGVGVTDLFNVGHDVVTIGGEQPEYINSDNLLNVYDGNLLVSNSARSAEFNLYCYNNGNTSAIPAWRTRSARGVRGAPTASQADDVLGRFGAAGFGYSGFPESSRGFLQFQASENWTDGAQGVYAVIATTATGSTSPAIRLYINESGISTNSGTHSWLLTGYTAGADAASNGYVTVTINGTAYKLMTRA